MIHDDTFINLVTRKLTGVADAKELQELDALLEQYPELQVRYQHLSRYFADPGHRVADNTEGVLQRTLDKIRNANTQQPVPVIRKWYAPSWKWAAAAAIAGLITASFWWFKPAAPRQSAANAEWLKQANRKGIKSFITLADGSRIWLNAESELKYPAKFNGNSREIFLEGEAFFDVATDAKRPFIVHLREGTIQVLGTSFNIRAYRNEPVQTAVVTGKVAFIPRYEGSKKAGDTILITPDVKVSYTAGSGTLVKDTTISSEEKAWTEGRLVFRNATLEEIGASLERNFGKQVIFEANAPKQYRLTGSFKNNSLQDIMYYLSRSKAFHYTITDSTLVIAE